MQLSNHLELEALESYDAWYENNQANLENMEKYWARRIKLVTALKEGAVISTATASRDVDSDKDEIESFGPDVARTARLAIRAARVYASATLGTTATFITRLSRTSITSTEVVASIGPPHAFELLRLFFEHLEVEFSNIQRDRMPDIEDFKNEVGDTLRTMYANLARFARESGDAFIERQLLASCMRKEDKKLQEMAHPYMLLQYGGRDTLAQVFAIVEQLDKGVHVEEAWKFLFVMTRALSH